MSRTVSKLPQIDPTFPDRLKPLAAKFYQQALCHPAYVFWSPTEIRHSIENRLWSIASRCPIWFGSGPATKREATEAQLAALAKAREARERLNEEEVERDRRVNARAETIAGAV